MPARIVIGTAGHIDHGKTSLVGVLTGMDTDRLAEEKRRGISIDLGFAHLTLPGGEQISFVDVPGHERFVRNMLAGAAGIEAVLLIIAADESVKPQTREHFEICRLLNIGRGLVVLTKCDLATAAQLEKAKSDAHELTRGSFLGNAPIIAVSSVTGAGLDELRRELARLANETKKKDALGFARLPIDRSFALKGFGTVVTGTLWSGALKVGDTVRLHPTLKEARVRGLQRHGQAVETAAAGDRTAVNLAGIGHTEIRRGFTLTSLNPLEATRALEVALDWLDRSYIPGKAAEFLLALGTAELPVTLKPLGAAFARLEMKEAVFALPGDRFVLRRPSPALTVAGGVVVDAFPPKRLNRAQRLARVQRLAAAAFHERLELLVSESVNGLPLAQLIRATGAPKPALPGSLLLVNGQHVVSKEWLAARRRKLVDWLEAFHAQNPSLAGAPVAQARLGLDEALFAPVVTNFAEVVMRDDTIALAAHRAHVSNADTQALGAIERAFRQAGFQPPAPAEVLRTQNNGRALLETLIKNGKLIRVSSDLIFHADVVAHIQKSLAAHKGRRFSVADFKAWTNISRKYAIPLLEYLDRRRVTRREGELRVVL